MKDFYQTIIIFIVAGKKRLLVVGVAIIQLKGFSMLSYTGQLTHLAGAYFCNGKYFKTKSTTLHYNRKCVKTLVQPVLDYDNGYYIHNSGVGGGMYYVHWCI